MALTVCMISSPRARKSAAGQSGGCQVEVDVAVAEMAERHRADAGISASQAADARLISSGTRETGTEMSFLTLAPSRFWASGAPRGAPHRLALRLALGDRGVRDQAGLERRFEHGLQRVAQPAALALDGELDQHVMRRPARERQGRPR